MLFRTGNCCGIFGCQFPLLSLDVSYNVALSSIQGCEILVGWWKMLACLAALVLLLKKHERIFSHVHVYLWAGKVCGRWTEFEFLFIVLSCSQFCDDVWSHHSIIKLWNQQFLFSTLVTHKKMINYAINWPWSEHRARKKLSRRWSMIQLRDLLNCFSFLFFFFTIIYWRSCARGIGRSISLLFIALLISSLMDSTLGQ